MLTSKTKRNLTGGSRVDVCAQGVFLDSILVENVTRQCRNTETNTFLIKPSSSGSIKS